MSDPRLVGRSIRFGLPEPMCPDERVGRDVSRPTGVALVVGGLATVAAVCWTGARGVEPVATWLYPFAWYPLLAAVEGGVALRRGRFLLLDRPRRLLSVLGWSVPLWMLWELLNFRLENWYYVFVPERRVALWTGVVVSFATVLPACFLPAALVWPGSGRSSGDLDPPPLSSATLGAIRLAGVAMVALPLIWPRFFFPLVWGATVLLVEPDLYRRAPSRSLLADATAGRWRRIGSLLAGGAAAGLAWEALNAMARGGWIYTVPFLERLKLFEMPLLGFLGFPPLALSCFALYQWLVGQGWAVPLDLGPDGEVESPDGRLGSGGEPEGARTAGAAPSPGGRSGAWAARAGAVGMVLATLAGMEAWTISSRTPRLRDLPGLLPSQVETLRAWGLESPFDLAAAPPEEVEPRVPGADVDEVRGWREAARLATTRGMGTRNARYLERWGVGSLDDLARTDPSELAACFARTPGTDVRSAQVRVWWRAARRRSPEPGPPAASTLDCD